MLKKFLFIGKSMTSFNPNRLSCIMYAAHDYMMFVWPSKHDLTCFLLSPSTYGNKIFILCHDGKLPSTVVYILFAFSSASYVVFLATYQRWKWQNGASKVWTTISCIKTIHRSYLYSDKGLSSGNGNKNISHCKYPESHIKFHIAKKVQ